MNLSKILLPILWMVKQTLNRLATFAAWAEYQVVVPAMDRIDKGYLDRRYAKVWDDARTNESQFTDDWHVVDFKDDFVLVANVSLETANKVLEEGYGGLMAVQFDVLTPKMRLEVARDKMEKMKKPDNA
jgi:hypothetical protein